MSSALPKVAFGTTLLDKGLNKGGIDGIGQYCQELLSQYSHHSNQFVALPFSFDMHQTRCGSTLLPAYTKYLAQSYFAPFRNTAAKHFFESADLIHATDQLIPVRHKQPLLSTVMDTIPLSHPEFLRTQSRFIKPYLWKKLTQQSDHIITISEFSKIEIANRMDYPSEKITVIPLAVDNRYFELIHKDQISETLKRFFIKRPFLLFIGSIQPRKNILRLLQAHASLPNNLANEFPLVIAGKHAWEDGETLHAIQKGVHEKRCIWLNYVSDFEKRCLLQAAEGILLPSLYEGFGLPILEGFASNTPVITSDCTSMPEVAGDCALLVNPKDLESIRQAMLTILENRSKINELVSTGLLRAKQFNWEKVASETIKVYKTLL